ncbi:uncharacterized protein VTP21DRAFT_9568 [Calcarisporiella thermophila]|uniref:uncharacterized protein n=1 Tax=Calcarisporiella thermophila TaxID=911321 RepID=UPI0037435769
MSDPFFITSRKRKKPLAANGKRSSKDRDELEEDDIGPGGIDDMDLEASEVEEESDEDKRETAAEKRLRLAKTYIRKIEEDIDEGGFDAAEIDRDLIAERLKKDVLETTGKMHRRVADTLKFPIDPSTVRTCRGHKLSVTSIAFTDTGILYTGAKDGSIVKWDARTGKRLHTYAGGRASDSRTHIGHVGHVLCLATSYDGKYLASGGRDRKINVWSIAENRHLKCFTQHKDAISGLAFRKGTNQLYSVSHDRTVKVWNVDELAYVETLFGHQDIITSVDTLTRERCVTTGGRDRTARLWKIVEESQLVFRGGAVTKDLDGSGRPRFVEGSLDVIALVDEEHFLTGGDSGTICLWNINKKKPIFTCPQAHGLRVHQSESEGSISTPYWITSLATLRYSDLFASGSCDGYVRLWRIDGGLKKFEQVSAVPMVGYVNDLALETLGAGLVKAGSIWLAAGIGQEPKLGRWERIKEARNGSRIVELVSSATSGGLSQRSEDEAKEGVDNL